MPRAIVQRFLPLAGAFVAGGLFAFGFAPYGYWLLGLIAVAVFAGALDYCDTRSRALLAGWLFGVGKYGFGVYWVYESIHVFGSAPPLLAGALVGLLVLILSIFPAIVALLYQQLRTDHILTNTIWLAVMWTLSEWVLTWFFTGFPWLFLGYAMVDTPLAYLAPVGGVLLVSLAGVWSAACWRYVISKPVLVLYAAVPWVISSVASTIEWTSTSGNISVALVQGNIPLTMKWDSAHAEAGWQRYRDLSRDVGDADLVVWPESAVIYSYDDVQSLVDAHLPQLSGKLAYGVIDTEESEDGLVYYNALAVHGDSQTPYYKRRLVMFGEYVPLEGLLRGLIDFFDLPMSSIRPGREVQSNLTVGGIEVAPAICFDVAYGAMIAETARQSNAIIAVSEDSWFGDSIGPWQHLQIAQMRAMETDRDVLRATNRGVSAIISPRDGIQSQSKLFETRVLQGSARVVTGSTPYMRWTDNLVLLLCLALAVTVQARGPLLRRLNARRE